MVPHIEDFTPHLKKASDIFQTFSGNSSQIHHCAVSHAKGKDVQEWTTNCLPGLRITVYELSADSVFASLLSEGEETISTFCVQGLSQSDNTG